MSKTKTALELLQAGNLHEASELIKESLSSIARDAVAVVRTQVAEEFKLFTKKGKDDKDEDDKDDKSDKDDKPKSKKKVDESDKDEDEDEDEDESDDEDEE